MCIQIFQRQNFQFSKSIGTNITDYMVSNIVVAGVHHPLTYRRNDHDNHDFFHNGKDSRHIYLPFADDQIHRITGEDRDIQGQYYRQTC